jgi:hypothetical protein
MSDQSAITTTSSKSVYSSIQSFDSAQRIAKSLAESDIVPRLYQGNLGNCIVALEFANRMGMSPFQVMQNLNVINGHPSWKSQFIIGLIQGCGRFESFDYDETPESCQCFGVYKATGKQVSGPKITLEMARAEGWTRNSKWRTMPGTMLRYRAASAFGRFHISDLILGIQSVEEVEVIDADIEIVDPPSVTKADQVNSMLATQPAPSPEPEVSESDDDFFD